MSTEGPSDGSGAAVDLDRSPDPRGSVVLRAEGLRKTYGAVRALEGVSLDIRAGSVLALLGENGAGKSTFVALASGAVRPDGGVLEVEGVAVRFSGPRDAIDVGIRVVHQEPRLIDEFTVAENILLSEIGSLAALRVRGTRDVERRAAETVASLGLSAALPRTTVLARTLAPSQRQLVAIAKAMVGRPKVLFLDEPNSSLTDAETTRLWGAVRAMRDRGVAVVIVSHRLTELYQVIDQVAVLRDGELVGGGPSSEITIPRALELMAGRDRTPAAHPGSAADARRDPARARTAEPLLQVRDLATSVVESATFDVHAGEILGLAGLVGSGRTEIGRAISGMDKVTSGSISLAGRRVVPRGPRAALRAGIVMTSEQRKKAVFGQLDVQDNLIASIYERVSRFGLVRTRLVSSTARDWVARLSVKGGPRSGITALSGGNQQKVLIARALATEPRVLVLDEPTHGVDVATRSEIYGIIRGLADDGLAVVLISSDTEELIAQSDRIVIVRDRRTGAELEVGADALDVVAAALGQKTDLALVREEEQ